MLGIERELRAHADPDRAEHERAYLKSGLEHIGVRVPVVRATVERHAPGDRDGVLALAGQLWSEPVHELRLAAVELLSMRVAVLESADLPLVELLLRGSRTWALVDHLAEKVAGGIVERDPAAATALDRWAADPDFWLRRSALLALLGPLRAGCGDVERFSRYADAMLDEREFFIRKAIGWVLRDIGRRRPELVDHWLGARPGRVPVLAVREAVKGLPESRRQPLIDAAARGRPASPPRP